MVDKGIFRTGAPGTPDIDVRPDYRKFTAGYSTLGDFTLT